MKDRVLWIDSAKGIAMLSVVLCHVVDGFYGAGMFSAYEGLLYDLRNLTNAFQMALFCMVSGFLYAFAYGKRDAEHRKSSIQKSILSFLTTYVIWCWLLGLVKIFFSGQVNKGVSVVDLFLVFCKPIGVYWYLYVLAALYFIFSFEFWSNVPLRKAFPLLIAVSAFGSALLNWKLGAYFEFSRILYYLLVFYIGMLYADEKRREAIQRIGRGLFAASLVLCVLFWNHEKQIYHVPVINLIVGIGVSLEILELCERICSKKVPAVLSFVGKNSLDVYILHVFITGSSRIVVRMIGIDNIWACIVAVFLAALLLPIGACMAAKKWGLYEPFFHPYEFISSKIRK